MSNFGTKSGSIDVYRILVSKAAGAFVCAIITMSAVTVKADTLYFAVGYSKPPYVIAEQNSGFEVELMMQIFKDMGHEIQPLYVPFGRTASLVKNGQVDIGLTLNERHDVDQNWLSIPYVGYQNVAVSITKNQFDIQTLDDLANFSIVAFQSAHVVLGSHYYSVVQSPDNPASLREDYLEFPDQSKQVETLMRRRVDVAVMDINIFTYFKSTLKAQYQVIPTTIHQVFPVNPYSAAIPDDDLRNHFNQTLETFIEDGRYKALLDKFELVDVIGLVTTADDESITAY